MCAAGQIPEPVGAPALALYAPQLPAPTPGLDAGPPARPAPARAAVPLYTDSDYCKIIDIGQ